MKKRIPPIINVDELFEIYKIRDIVLVDASGGPNAKSNYDKNHLEGALFVDLNTQLANIKDDLSDGGRHPLPTLEDFAQTLSELGISKKSQVVIYDDNNGANAAARFWWMLRSAGHEKVQVLNGGFQAAEKMGFPLNANPVVAKESNPNKIENWNFPLAQMQEVENVSQDENHVVVDVRDHKRYCGEFEPIDLIAGHIPGAINIPFAENLDNSGLFLSPENLKNKYQEAFKSIDPDNIIVHCGSGVTACHTLLAIDYAGLAIPKLYTGSWSEWCRNDKAIGKR